MTDDIATTLRRVIGEGNVGFDEKDAGTLMCQRNGWIYRVHTGQHTPDAFVLPTRLHEK